MISNRVKALVRRLLGEETMGFLEYRLFPERRERWHGPFNEQLERERLVRALLRLKPDVIVETGTFRGRSTAFFARNGGCPVITVELNARSFGFSRARLRRFKNVEILKQDSRQLLTDLAERESLRGAKPFFYLDAHWNEDLPLAEEIDLAFRHWPGAVVLVDDFQVPGDSGYGYDDYGPGKALTLDYVRPLRDQYGLRVYFPSAPAADETGACRGCAVFVSDPGLASRVVEIPELRSSPWE